MMTRQGQLETFEFRIMCADTHESCSFVKGLMYDFEVRDARAGAYFDHIGTRDFEGPDQALKRLKDLEDEAGGRIKNAVLARTR